MPSRINIGPENGPYVAINESSGNLQLEDNSGNVVAEWDDGQSQWDFVENDISGVGAFASESVNTERKFINERQIYAQSSEPADPDEEDVWLDSGNGRVLAWDGFEWIHDGSPVGLIIVDDFEWGGPVGDRYTATRGSIDDFSINQEEPVLSGDFSLKSASGDDIQAIYSEPGDGLNYYPEAGDTLEWTGILIDPDSAPAVAMLDPTGDFDTGVTAELNGRDDIVALHVDGNFEVETESVTFETDKWYLSILDTEVDGDDLIVSLTVHDGATEDAPILSEFSYTDENSALLDEQGVKITDFRDMENCAFNRLAVRDESGN